MGNILPIVSRCSQNIVAGLLQWCMLNPLSGWLELLGNILPTVFRRSQMFVAGLLQGCMLNSLQAGSNIGYYVAHCIEVQ